MTVEQARRIIGRRSLAAGALLVCALAVALATPQLLGTRVEPALDVARRAPTRGGSGSRPSASRSPSLGSAGSWRSAIGLCGGRTSLDRRDRPLRRRLARRTRSSRPAPATPSGSRSSRALLPGEQRSAHDRRRVRARSAPRARSCSARSSSPARSPARSRSGRSSSPAPSSPPASRSRCAPAPQHDAHLLDAFRALGDEPARRACGSSAGWRSRSRAASRARPRSGPRSASAARSSPPS